MNSSDYNLMTDESHSICRIIKDIMELWKVFRLARFVRRKTNEDPNYALESFLIAHFQDTKRRFIFKRYSAPQIRAIIDYAIVKEYLEPFAHGHGRHLRIAVPKGSDLLDIPLGTLQTFLHEYGLAISFITGGFFTAFIFTVTDLAVRLFRFLI